MAAAASTISDADLDELRAQITKQGGVVKLYKAEGREKVGKARESKGLTLKHPTALVRRLVFTSVVAVQLKYMVQ